MVRYLEIVAEDFEETQHRLGEDHFSEEIQDVAYVEETPRRLGVVRYSEVAVEDYVEILHQLGAVHYSAEIPDVQEDVCVEEIPHQPGEAHFLDIADCEETLHQLGEVHFLDVILRSLKKK